MDEIDTKVGSASHLNREPKTLLIVDDDKPFRERLAKAMERRGFIVTAVESAAEGISMAK